jgi:Fe-S-cluster containining protein
MPAFRCSGCGLCCKVAPLVHPDWPKRADGACLHLSEDNRCKIYEARPRACRVDAMRPEGLTVEEWHSLNEAACAELQKAAP